MLKYILYDFKRALKSGWAKIYFFATLALILIANIAIIAFRFIYGSNEGTFSYNVFEYASWCFLIPYYSCIILGIMAFGDTYIQPRKHGMKLGVPESDGRDSVVMLKPWQLYIEKIIASMLLAIVFLVNSFVLLYVLTTIFHINEGLILWGVVKSFLEKAALAVPLWFAGISFAVMFLFMFERKWIAVLGFVVVTVIIPQIIRIFSLDSFKFEFFRSIRKFTITQSFGLVPYPSYPDRSVPLIVAIGLVYGFVAMIVGISVYNKKAS